jgi:hypothetical protein
MNKITSLLAILFFSLNIHAQEISDEEYLNVYLVVSDTSRNYFELREKMFVLNQKLKTEIDTMGRSYDPNKNLICLAEDDEDEIYAGGYLFRRSLSEFLSLEYLIYYQDEKNTTEKTIALVTIITDSKEEAENKLLEVKKYSKNAFIVNSQIYMGCMH